MSKDTLNPASETSSRFYNKSSFIIIRSIQTCNHFFICRKTKRFSCRKSRPSDVIYEIIRDMATAMMDGSFSGATVKLSEAQQRCVAKGYTYDQFQAAITAYEDINVWYLNNTKTSLTFV